jgi:hypothetical protein
MAQDVLSEGHVANSLDGWIIEYGTLNVDCRDEEDVVRGLRWGARVAARIAYGVFPGRRLEGANLAKWPSE